MRYERVKIKRDERTVYNRPVLPWEIAILEFTFGDGSVERLGVFVDTPTEYPDPKEELMRLMQTYGADPESGIPYVASVYGQAAAGIRGLTAEIKEAKADARKAAPKQPRKKLIKEFSGDSLMG